MARALVVGGGIGGLACAIRLRAAGHDVTVLERRDEWGGKLTVRERDGYVFDIGPSLVTLPALYDECFGTVGASLTDEVDLRRLDPQFRYSWPDGSTLVVPDDPEATARAFEAFRPGAGAAWQSFAERAGRIWDVSERTFFAGPMANPISLLRRMRSPADFAAIDAMTSLAARARRTFGADPRLAQWAGRYATYSGSSPFRTPATLGCIVHVESHYGAWYPMGGLGALRDAFVRVATRAGVELITGTEVGAITRSADRVTGVELGGAGGRLGADVVVANVDASHLYTDLLPDRRVARRVRRAGRSTSGYVVLAGVRGATPDLAHHNVYFGPDEQREFTQLTAGEYADAPTVYACVSSVTDPSQAPPVGENWFLLVNAPARSDGLPDGYESVVFDMLAQHGVDLRDRLAFTEVIAPADLEARYRSPGGAIYGTSSNGRRAAFARPGNRGPVRGLYLVGGSSHPGGGLPLVTISARIVADLVREDGW